MHVHVHLAQRQREKNHGYRVAAGGLQGVVSLDHSIGQPGIFNPAPVDKERNLAAVGAVQAGWPHVAVHLDRVPRPGRLGRRLSRGQNGQQVAG